MDAKLSIALIGLVAAGLLAGCLGDNEDAENVDVDPGPGQDIGQEPGEPDDGIDTDPGAGTDLGDEEQDGPA